MRSVATRALLLGTLAVGVLDILDALIFFSLRVVSPIRILQSIAPGAALRRRLLHRVGALHRHALSAVAASTTVPLRRDIRFLAYFGMNYVVVPLSAAAVGSGPRMPNISVGSS